MFSWPMVQHSEPTTVKWQIFAECCNGRGMQRPYDKGQVRSSTIGAWVAWDFAPLCGCCRSTCLWKSLTNLRENFRRATPVGAASLLSLHEFQRPEVAGWQEARGLWHQNHYLTVRMATCAAQRPSSNSDSVKRHLSRRHLSVLSFLFNFIFDGGCTCEKEIHFR